MFSLYRASRPELLMLSGCIFCFAFYADMEHVLAQRVILFEDFESSTPDALPGSANFYARSSINPDPNLDPSTAVVTGGNFADPFNPGNNQSLLLYNPHGTTQQAVTWTSAFGDDPSTFRNGSIEFDLWMDSPDPNAFWSFLGVRMGHGDETRTGVSGTTTDTTVWNTFRLQNVNEDLREQISDPGNLISLGLETTFTDNGDDVMGPDRSFRVRYEIKENGYSFMSPPSYQLYVDDNLITWLQDGANEHFWVFQPGPALAPGINTLSFFTDASAHNSNPNPGTGNVYIDNLLIINYDLSPVVTDFNGDGITDGSDFLIWQRGLGIGTTVAEGDADGNGAVNADDLALWEQFFGTVAPPMPLATNSATGIPEPNSLLIALCGMLFCISRRLQFSGNF